MATDNKYDRQLRLWGANGQKALMEARVLLLGAGPAGTETLKNLVLPGIGSFTVVDGADVTISDLGNNFFLEEEQIGKKRAECVTALLQELNEHVSGSYVNEDISEVLAARPDFLNSFTMVIATQMTSQETLKQVSALCAARKLPLLIVHTYGFLGYLRMDLGEHQVRSRPYPPPRTQERAARAFAPAPPAVIPGRELFLCASSFPCVYNESTHIRFTFCGLRRGRGCPSRARTHSVHTHGCALACASHSPCAGASLFSLSRLCRIVAGRRVPSSQPLS